MDLDRHLTKHLEFDFIGASPSGKTKIWAVNNLSNGTIGEIRWAGNFRKYALYPYNMTLFDSKCLRDIADFLDVVTKDR